ncbi:MAG: hypothetical protein EXQ52_01395 [Bryobacterales bacterium]|nr:hypothetical protein [Bryobacterales bacterium]
MKIDDGDFVIIGENIHTTRMVLRTGKLVEIAPDGQEAVRYTSARGETRFLPIPEAFKRTQDYDEGRIKHVKIAIHDAMAGGSEGREYLLALVGRQSAAGADFLDLNVDEVSLRPAEQIDAMRWLVETIQSMTDIPVSIDSSNLETIVAGLDAARGRALLNSASLERIGALDIAASRGIPVVVTAAGEKGMPQNDIERVGYASRMVDAALERGIAKSDLYVDPLVFPISVDSQFGIHCFDAIRTLRAKYGPEIHITGGLSNVSFGLPSRRVINDVFINLAVSAGADSGIVDPVATDIRRVFSLDKQARPYQLAEDMLLGRDRNCKNFLRAYRKGELAAV